MSKFINSKFNGIFTIKIDLFYVKLKVIIIDSLSEPKY